MALAMLGLVGSSAVISGNADVELVLAVKEGDKVDWAQKYASDVRVTTYNKGAPLEDSSISEVALPNVGREAHAYLYHIVHRFDSLARKTVFAPGGMPTSGFQGFAQSGASLLPGVKLEDYLSADASEMLIPTMALSPDAKQFSVRMSLMDNKTESGLASGTRYSLCSADGTAGWSPFLPNKFASSVLEPLMQQQQAKYDFGSFWKRFMREMPMPERVLAAHSPVFSVSRDSIRSHPKALYEAMLAELESGKDPYQAFFLDYMWYYLFHTNAPALCNDDFEAPASRKAASRALSANKRRLGQVITVLHPFAGENVEFGSTVNIEWTTTHSGFYRVELWRYGGWLTRLYDSKYLTPGTPAGVHWHLYPGPKMDDAPATTGMGKTFSALRNTNPSGTHTFGTGANAVTIANPDTTKAWFHFFDGVKPGDRYTIRVCPYDESFDEQICDNVFGESGEFNILRTIDVMTPVRLNTYKPGDFVPITWQSYYVDGSTVDISMYFEGREIWKAAGTTDDGVYTFFVAPDMQAGVYEITVSAPGESCTVGSCKTSFTMLAHASPPIAPPSPPPPPPSPVTPGNSASWEVPIIQAFKGSFGFDEIKPSSENAGQQISSTSTVAGGLNCNYVCHVHTMASGRRRLLFGGLQYYDGVDTNFLGCSADMKKCCCDKNTCCNQQ
jgi:hypothetical protein